jgi:hypothetical protein
MSTKGQIKDALTEFVKNTAKTNLSLVCEVEAGSYDAIKKTVYCIPLDEYADIPNVRICPEKTVDGFVIIPKDSSLVVVSFMENGSPYISMFSEVDEIHLAGQSYGGIAKTLNVKTKINALETEANNFKIAIGLINTAAGVNPATPITTGLLAGYFAGTNLTPITPTTQSEISNDMVKHGDNT